MLQKLSDGCIKLKYVRFCGIHQLTKVMGYSENPDLSNIYKLLFF